MKLPAELYEVDVLCRNDSEERRLLGRQATGDALDDARRLRACGARAVAMKLRAHGSLAVDEDDNAFRAKPYKVKVVDTTAAGDLMTAGLAVALGEGRAWREALRFGNAAGTLTCTKLGAQPSTPTRKVVERLLRRS